MIKIKKVANARGVSTIIISAVHFHYCTECCCCGVAVVCRHDRVIARRARVGPHGSHDVVVRRGDVCVEAGGCVIGGACRNPGLGSLDSGEGGVELAARLVARVPARGKER